MTSPDSLVSTPVRIGRLSSLAAAKTTSHSASRSWRASALVAGASPMAATTGNSSASIPLMLERLPPQVTFRVRSLADSCRSIRWFGSDMTRSVSSLAGTVISPSASTLPGTQQLMPISRLVAVSFRPLSSVLSRTFASTGSVARLLTARLTTPRPRARFSCITEMFIRSSSSPRLSVLSHWKNTYSAVVPRRGVNVVDRCALPRSDGSHSAVGIRVPTVDGRGRFGAPAVDGGGISGRRHSAFGRACPQTSALNPRDRRGYPRGPRAARHSE